MVRNSPLPHKGFIIRMSTKLPLAPEPSPFYSRQLDLQWSARGFPDLLTRHMLFEGLYQEDVLVAIRGLLRPGETYIDVGGHHGLMAIVAARAVGPRGSVISFEPNPYSRRLFEEGCALNRIGNIRIEDLALSDHAGRARFYIQTGLVSWNSSLFAEFASQGGRDNVEEVEVQMTTLDAYLQSGPEPAFIKVDAEGSEFLVLRGAVDVIARRRPVISIEFNPESAAAAGTSIHEQQQFLGNLGYRLIVLKPNWLGNYSLGSWEVFDEQRHATKNLENVLCIPPDRIEMLSR